MEGDNERKSNEGDSPSRIESPGKESIISKNQIKNDDDLERKNQEAEKTLEKLISQNEKLSQEIKEIRDQIMLAIEKNKKKSQDKPEPEDPALKELTQKIENQNKEIASFQKELKLVKDRLETKKTKEKIKDLENTLKFKQYEMDKLVSDKKILEEIKVNHQNLIESMKSEKDYAKKISSFQDEIRKLKDELREQQKKENEIEKTQRKQQEYLTVLEQKYREGCKKLGVSPSLNFTRAAKYDEIINLKSKSNQKLEINKSLSVEPKKKVIKLKEKEQLNLPTEVNEANYKILQEKYKELQTQRQNSLKIYKQQEETQITRLKELELEKTVLQTKLKEKESECKISISKLKEVKRIAKNFPLPSPIDLPEKPLKGLSELNKNKSLSKIALDTKRRKTNRKAAGNLNSESNDLIIFDDGDLLGDYSTIDFLIKEINVYHDGKNKIYGLQAKYYIDGELVDGHDNISKTIKELKTTQISTWSPAKKTDSLKFISGYYLDNIEYLKIESLEGQNIIVGSISGERARTLKEFCIDIKKDDIGTVLFGGLDYKKNGTSNDILLSYIGIETINSSLLQKSLIRKKLETNNDVDLEENIGQNEDQNSAKLQRRGLNVSKITPIKKKY